MRRFANRGTAGLYAEFLRRVIPFDSGSIDDEETVHAADEIFSMLDAEENDAVPVTFLVQSVAMRKHCSWALPHNVYPFPRKAA